jgi:hypothetical protein
MIVELMTFILIIYFYTWYKSNKNLQNIYVSLYNTNSLRVPRKLHYVFVYVNRMYIDLGDDISYAVLSRKIYNQILIQRNKYFLRGLRVTREKQVVVAWSWKGSAVYL